MKFKGLFVLLSIIIIVSFSACSKDDNDKIINLENQEHTVEYKIFSNVLDAQIMVSNFNGSPLIITSNWETKFVTKDWFAQFDARCDDETVLITGEIYVDGVLKLRREANRLLNVTVKIK